MPITSALAGRAEDGRRRRSRTRLGSARSSNTVVGTTRVPLDGDQRAPARVGNQPRRSASPTPCAPTPGADIAIMNSGSIRGDRVFPAGPLTRRTLVEMHPFGNVICTLAVPGRVVLAGAEPRRLASCRRPPASFRRCRA